MKTKLIMKTKITTVTIKFDTTGAIKVLAFRPEIKLPCVEKTLNRLSNCSNEFKSELIENMNTDVSDCLCGSLTDITVDDISYDCTLCICYLNDKVHEISVEYYLVDKLPVLNN